MVTTPILIFPDWKKTFHVHVDASSIALGIILAQLGEGDIDHPIAFASRKLSSAERNYTTIVLRFLNPTNLLTGVKIPRNKGGHYPFRKSQLDSRTFGMAGLMGLWTHYHSK